MPDDGKEEQSIGFLRTYGGTPEEIEAKAGERKSVNLVLAQDGF